MKLTDVVELTQTNDDRVANAYLEHGYKLLGVTEHTQPKNIPGHEKGYSYVSKRPAFVLGRAADVPHWDRPTRPVQPVQA